MNTFPISGKKLLLDMLSARPLRAALLDSAQAELQNGDGYETGGQILANPRTGIDGDVAYLTFDDVKWQNAAFSGARYLQIYDASGPTSDLRLLTSGATPVATIDFGADKAGQGADFTYKFPRTGGVIRI